MKCPFVLVELHLGFVLCFVCNMQIYPVDCCDVSALQKGNGATMNVTLCLFCWTTCRAVGEVLIMMKIQMFISIIRLNLYKILFVIKLFRMTKQNCSTVLVFF